MKQTNPWNKILSVFRIKFHPDKSACQPDSTEFVNSSFIPDLKGYKTGEWETDDETFDDSPAFEFSGAY